MSNRRYLIYNKSFSEYAYRIFCELSADKKSELSTDDLKVLKDKASINRFVHEAPFEQIILLLTKIGKSLDIRIYDEPEDVDQLEEIIINQFELPEQQVQSMEIMAKKNIFYLSSRDIMMAAMMAAQNVHNKVYQLAANSRELIKKHYSITSVKLRYDDQIDQCEEAYMDFNSILLEQLNALDWANKTLNLDLIDIRVLSALFAKRHGALLMQDIARSADLESNNAKLKKNMDKLQERRLIMSDKNDTSTKQKQQVFYMLTTQGIKAIMEYSNYVYKQAISE